MAKEIPSVGDLRRKSEVTDDEIGAAAAAYPKDEIVEPFGFKSGHRVDVAKAIEVHPQAQKLLADAATTPGLRRTMVMTAVIMGFPVQGMSPDDADPVHDAVAALRAAGVTVAPVGNEFECWQIGDLIFSDSDVLRQAERRGPVEAS